VFDQDQVLISTETASERQVIVSVHLVDAKGRLLGSARGEKGSSALLLGARGKALASSVVLVPTDRGLVSARPDAHRRLVEGAVFVDTEAFCSEDAELIPGPGGSVYVITARDITELRLSP
jgi:hypothetical protein